MRYATIKTWADWFEKNEGVNLGRKTIKDGLREIAANPCMGKDRHNHIAAFFSEADVRRACADLLNPELIQCDADGFADINGVCHGTFNSLAKRLGLSESCVKHHFVSSGISPVRGKGRGSRMVNLWPEPKARELCVDLLGPNIPVCGEEGLVNIEGVRHGTVAAIARLIGISEGAISHRLVASDISFVRGKVNGVLVKLYPEPVVLKLCAEKLDSNLYRCGPDGSVKIDGVRQGTVGFFVRLFGVCDETISRYLASSGATSIRGKNKIGHLVDLWPEPVVRKLIEDCYNPDIPQCGEDGFAIIGGVRYGAKKSIAQLIGVSYDIVSSHLDSSKLSPILGKDIHGVMRKLYPEPAVREICALVANPKLHQCDKGNFTEIDGDRHGTISAFAHILGISGNAISNRLVSSSLSPTIGKDAQGVVRKLYSEPQIRELCADLLNLDLPRCGKDGFADISGIRHGTITFLARTLKVSGPTIESRIATAHLDSVRGKDMGGHIVNLYSEPALRELCADLNDSNLVQVGVDGFAMMDGVRYRTIKSFSQNLGISRAAILSRLASSGLILIHGKDKMGHLVDLYPEPAVRGLCRDLIEKKSKKSNPKPE
jgi:hypothetical protein